KLFNAIKKLLSSTFSNQFRCISFMEAKCFLLERKLSRACTVNPSFLRGRAIISMYLFSSFTGGLKMICISLYPFMSEFFILLLFKAANNTSFEDILYFLRFLNQNRVFFKGFVIMDLVMVNIFLCCI